MQHRERSSHPRVLKSPRERSPFSERDSKPNLRARSQQLFLSTKQLFVAGVSDAISFVAPENTEITPQNGFYFVKPTQEYIAECIFSPDKTLIDLRDTNEYREQHLRTSINLPYKYLNLPTFDDDILQEELETINKENKKEQMEFIPPEPLLTDKELEENREYFKNTWIEDILHYSIKKNIPHEFIIYGSCPRAKRSTILPCIVHVLTILFKEAILSNRLSIYVFKRKFY